MEAGQNAVITGLDTDKTQKPKTNVFKILNTTNTFDGENCESSWFEVSV
jgi:hypothetical protein